jgi:DNA-binding transcriptional regulator LsrR (DeoR family)
MEWAQVRALAADGVSQREIAARLGINRRTVARLAAAAEPPRYSRVSTASMLDPLEPVIGRLLAEWPEMRAPRLTEILREDYGYGGSVDLVKRRLAKAVVSAVAALAPAFLRERARSPVRGSLGSRGDRNRA